MFVLNQNTLFWALRLAPFNGIGPLSFFVLLKKERRLATSPRIQAQQEYNLLFNRVALVDRSRCQIGYADIQKDDDPLAVLDLFTYASLLVNCMQASRIRSFSDNEHCIGRSLV